MLLLLLEAAIIPEIAKVGTSCVPKVLENVTAAVLRLLLA